MMTIAQESQWSSRMMRALFAGLFLVGFATDSPAIDPTAGQKIFNMQCGICHSATEGRNGLGPSVVGRRAGSVSDFNYTADHKKLGITWNTATLNKYLTNPRARVPETSMIYPGLKDNAQRADLVAYLASLH
jgi:cytochrome c